MGAVPDSARAVRWNQNPSYPSVGLEAAPGSDAPEWLTDATGGDLRVLGAKPSLRILVECEDALVSGD